MSLLDQMSSASHTNNGFSKYYVSSITHIWYMHHQTDILRLIACI